MKSCTFHKKLSFFIKKQPLFIENYPPFKKNHRSPLYRKLQPLISAFIKKNSIFGKALVMQDFFSGDCWHSRRRQGTRSCKSRVRGFLGDHRQAGLAPHLAGAPRYIATGFQGNYCCNIAGFIAVLPGTALRMSWCLCLPQLARFMS